LKKVKLLKKIEKNKIFISKFTRASSTGIYSDYSSQRYNEIQTIDKSPYDFRDINHNDKFLESHHTDRLSDNLKETIDYNIKIKDLKRNNYRHIISISRNLKKDFNSSVNKNLPKTKQRIKTSRIIIPSEEPSTRAQSVGNRKLTFSYNQSIPILLQKSKDRSKLNSLSKIFKHTNDVTVINFQEDLGTIEDNKKNPTNVKAGRSDKEESYGNKGKQKDVNLYISQ
jgi:hypothetical protein